MQRISITQTQKFKRSVQIITPLKYPSNITGSNIYFATGFYRLLACLSLLLILSGCHTTKINTVGKGAISIKKPTPLPPDLLLDSSTFAYFYKTFPVSDTIKKELKQFYNRRSNHIAWFNDGHIIAEGREFYSLLQNFTVDFIDSSLYNAQLDSFIKLIQLDEQKFNAQTVNVKQLDLLLTTTYFKYANKVYEGIIKTPADMQWFIPRKKKNYQVLLDSLVSQNKREKVNEPLNEYYFQLSKKLSIYRKIQQNGGFVSIPGSKNNLNASSNDSAILMVKEHLFLTGDLQINDYSINFTDTLRSAIMNFQRRIGLIESGVLDVNTITELNVPVELRIKQIMVNMQRLRWMPEKMESNYLLINIPDYKLNVFENNKKIWDMNVVVGKTATQTNIFKGSLSRIIINPYWVVPSSIIINEIIPQIISDTSYLTNNNMEVLKGDKLIDAATVNWADYTANGIYTIRQKPGIQNALGRMKFIFPNNFSIYLHDTPLKGYFTETKRDFSHGCIRVAEPKKLALYLLRNNPDVSFKKIEQVLQTDIETSMRVHPAVPVYIVYFTAWVDNNGQLNFRKDLYDLDNKIVTEFSGQ